MAKRRYTEEARRLQPFIAQASGDVARTEIVRLYGKVEGDLIPDLPDTRDLGSSDKPWRKGWVSEFDAVVFAKNTQTLVGGYLMVGQGEGTLAADVAAGDAQIDFGQAMTAGDFVVFRAAGQVEYVQVGALVSGTIYAVTRNLDGSGANDWPAGGVYAILGQDGDGRIVLNAIDTPRLQIFRQGSAYNLATEMLRAGDMNGAFGITSMLYGIGIGDYANGNYLRYDPVNGFRLSAGSTALAIDNNGFRLQAEDWSSSNPTAPYRIDYVDPATEIPTTSLYGSYAKTGQNLSHFQISAKALDNAHSSEIGRSEVWVWADANYQNDNAAAEVRLHARTKDSSSQGGVGQQYYSEILIDSAALLGPNQIRFNIYDGLTHYFKYTKNGLTIVRNGGPTAEIDLSDSVAKIELDGQSISLPDGWTPSGETWTYASASTFTVSGDVRSKYPVGTKIKLTQSSTVKYFYVTGTSYTSPNTTVTIGGAKSVPLANATITDNYLSYASTPQGYPWTSDWVYPNDSRWVGTANAPLGSTSWDGDSFSTTAKTLLDLSAVFGVPDGVKAVMLFIWVRDSGSETTDTYLILGPANGNYIGMAVDPHPVNDRITRKELIVSCNNDGDIYYQIGASGTLTFDIMIQVHGYQLF